MSVDRQKEMNLLLEMMRSKSIGETITWDEMIDGLSRTKEQIMQYLPKVQIQLKVQYGIHFKNIWNTGYQRITDEEVIKVSQRTFNSRNSSLVKKMDTNLTTINVGSLSLEDQKKALMIISKINLMKIFTDTGFNNRLNDTIVRKKYLSPHNNELIEAMQS